MSYEEAIALEFNGYLSGRGFKEGEWMAGSDFYRYFLFIFHGVLHGTCYRQQHVMITPQQMFRTVFLLASFY